jgi:hypothetical protein
VSLPSRSRLESGEKTACRSHSVVSMVVSFAVRFAYSCKYTQSATRCPKLSVLRSVCNPVLALSPVESKHSAVTGVTKSPLSLDRISRFNLHESYLIWKVYTPPHLCALFARLREVMGVSRFHYNKGDRHQVNSVCTT